MADERSRERIETTLLELLTAIQEVSASEDEAFRVLESMRAQGRIGSVGGPPTRAVSATRALPQAGRVAASVGASRSFGNHVRSA